MSVESVLYYLDSWHFKSACDEMEETFMVGIHLTEADQETIKALSHLFGDIREMHGELAQIIASAMMGIPAYREHVRKGAISA